MKVLSVLFKYSKVPFLLAVLAATASGVFNSGILVLIHRFLATENLEGGRQLILGFVALCLLVPLSRFGSSYLLLHLSQKAIFDLRLGLCRKILSAPLRRLEEVGSHRLMATLTEDIGSIATSLMGFPFLCMNLAVVLGSLAYLCWLSWQVFLLMLGVIVVGIFSYQVPMRWGSQRQRRTREVADKLYHHFKAVTEGMKELKLHRRRRRAFLHQLSESAARFQKLNITAQSIFSAAASLGQMMVFIAVGVVVLGVPGVVPVDREVATGFAFVLIYLMAPFQAILDALPEISQANVSIIKVEDLGLSLLQGDDPPDSSPGAAEPEIIEAEPAWERIELRDVILHYTAATVGERSFSLGPLDLELRRGELVFIIGGNGSGKTTLMKVLAGLYVPQEGRILVDGEEVTEENREDYRQMFTAVFSDFFLFQDLLGLDHPELDSRARKYLELLELDHKVTVTGGELSTTELSQGQRKRLALLTAYLEDRSFYLFDEWAADQDPVYKEVFYRQILGGLKRRAKTVVVICHDDRFFDEADRLVKLENGRLVNGPVALPDPSSFSSRPLSASPEAQEDLVPSE